MALITLRQLPDHAAEHAYGLPAFSIDNMEQGLAVMEAARATDLPVIIQASRGGGLCPPSCGLPPGYLWPKDVKEIRDGSHAKANR